MSLSKVIELGFARLRHGQLAEALGQFERALKLDPDCLEALIGSASAWLHLGRAGQALRFSTRAVYLRPGSAAAQATAAAVFLALKKPQDALAPAEHAVRIQPDLFQGHFNHAEALRALGQHEKALEAYDRTLALEPRFVPALCGRGQTCREMGDERTAAELYQRALTIEPNHAAARFGWLFSCLPTIPGLDDELDHSRQAFASELSRFDDWWAQHDAQDEQVVASMTPPFHLAYQDRPNVKLLTSCGQTYARLMARWAARRTWAAAPLASVGDSRIRAGIVTAGDSRIRAGIVTAHMHEHSVFRALTKGWLGQLDRDRVHISVFNLDLLEDATTVWARSQAEFVQCNNRTLSECIEDIQGRRIDVLLYPEVGMDLTTLQLASLRLARHQIAAWGHPETTGLPTIDCYLSAAAFEPADADSNYSEELIRLPNLGCYYEPYGVVGSAPDLDALGIVADVPLLLCAGTPFKYGAEHDDALVDIARELGRCQIVLFEARPRALSAKLLARLHGRFHDAGLDPERHLVMVPWLSQEAFFGLLRRATVYLDSPGFSGFNTVMQAIECDLPVVAFEGAFMRGRFASGILRQLHLEELIAADHTEYVRHVSRLVGDLEFRDRVRAHLRRAGQALYRDRTAIDALMEFMAGLAAYPIGIGNPAATFSTGCES